MPFHGSQLFGLGFNLWQGQQQFEANERLRAQQQGDIDRMMGLISGAPNAGQLVGQAQGLANQGIQQGNQLFSQVGQNQRFQRFMGSTMQGLQGLPGQVGQQTAGLNQLAAGGGVALQRQFGLGGQNLMRNFGQRTGQVGGQFQQLFNQAQQVSAGLGQQERADINRRFDQFGARQAADLQERGFSASTGAAAIQRGVEEQRGQELGGLGERLRREQVGILGQFGGAAASANERLTGQQLGAQQQLLGAGTALGQNLLGQQLQTGQFGAGLGANVGLQSLGMQGGFGMGQLGMLQQAGMNQMNNLMGFGQLPISTGMFGLQQGLGAIGSINRIPAGRFQNVQIQPSG
jgi:hypothetical protein